MQVSRYFMIEITSKENRKTIWLSIFFSMLFFGALGSFMNYIFYKMWLNNEIENKTYLMPIFALLVYFIGFSFVKSYIKKSPKIILDFEKIKIKDKTYYWKDIQNVKMTGKKGFGLFSYQMETTTLNFNNNNTEYIFDDFSDLTIYRFNRCGAKIDLLYPNGVFYCYSNVLINANLG